MTHSMTNRSSLPCDTVGRQMDSLVSLRQASAIHGLHESPTRSFREEPSNPEARSLRLRRVVIDAIDEALNLVDQDDFPDWTGRH